MKQVPVKKTYTTCNILCLFSNVLFLQHIKTKIQYTALSEQIQNPIAKS